MLRTIIVLAIALAGCTPSSDGFTRVEASERAEEPDRDDVISSGFYAMVGQSSEQVRAGEELELYIVSDRAGLEGEPTADLTHWVVCETDDLANEYALSDWVAVVDVDAADLGSEVDEAATTFGLEAPVVSALVLEVSSGMNSANHMLLGWDGNDAEFYFDLELVTD